MRGSVQLCEISKAETNSATIDITELRPLDPHQVDRFKVLLVKLGGRLTMSRSLALYTILESCFNLHIFIPPTFTFKVYEKQILFLERLVSFVAVDSTI